jgi:hypothetical protein
LEVPENAVEARKRIGIYSSHKFTLVHRPSSLVHTRSQSFINPDKAFINPALFVHKTGS